MDILPIYFVFLGLTPPLLQFAARRGWRRRLIVSALLWLAAQLQAGRGLYDLLADAGYPLPRDAWSSCDWFAWQLMWIAGRWLGSTRREAGPAASESATSRSPGFPRSTYALLATIGAAVILLCARHHVGGFMSALDPNGPLTSKWRLGPLRLANFAVLGFVAHRLPLPLLHWLRVGALELLGRASLQVFTAHIPVCILANGLLLDTTPMPVSFQSALLASTFGVMLLVAWKANAPRRVAAATRGHPNGPMDHPSAAARVGFQARQCDARLNARRTNAATVMSSATCSSCPIGYGHHSTA
jgi:hypothetical protein